jgi:starvation-inducible DNA-binding protein
MQSFQFRNVDNLNQAGVLKFLLGMEYVLYAKVQNFHWNLVGMSFIGLHKLLDKHYKQIGKFIDRIAEQIRKYGQVAPGSLQEFLILNSKANGIEEVSGELINETNAVSLSVIAHERIIQTINSLEPNLIDLATQNLLGDLLDFHMTAAWMLNSHLA